MSTASTTATSGLDIATAPLDGQSAIEASAGTGKTFAITRLYLRLLLEGGLGVEQILVVTYTVTATEELRGRIRDLLANVRSQLAEGRSRPGADALGDELVRELAGRVGTDVVTRRIDDALRGFDEAAIFTIHGFCQRVLAETAFESAMPFEAELVPDESQILAEVAQDFWRRRVYDASPLTATYLAMNKIGPDELLGAVRSFVGKPYVSRIAPAPPPPLEPLEARFAAAFARARLIWSEGRDVVVAMLRDMEALGVRSYPRRHVESWAAEIDDLLRTKQPSLDRPKHALRFTRASIEDALEKARGERAASKPSRKRAQTPTPQAPSAPLQHDFFDACTELLASRDELVDAYEIHLRHLRAELLDLCSRELPARKRRRGLRSYDDLLLDLREALARDGGGRLAAAIRDRYRAALIDEFQDTDPIQYEIFRTVYRDSGLPVFLVGDPKQAIYSFRGADVFTYLDARRDARHRHRLEHNWRSRPELIRAVNTVFDRCDRPFLIDDIPFTPALPAPTDHQVLHVEGDPTEPFWLWVLRRPAPEERASRVEPGEPREGEDQGEYEAEPEGGAARRKRSDAEKPIGREQGRETAARATAAEVARLLRLGAERRARIGDRPLEGGDIAVLVRTNREAKLVRRELLRLSVPSVQRGTESVFATREAEELERLVLAIATPGDESRLKAALASEMLGVSGEDLQSMHEPGGESEWEERAERIRAYHRLWSEQGFVRMFRQMLASEHVLERLLPLADGERRLTNLLHLGELLQGAEVGQRLGIEQLLRWMADRRAATSEAADERAEERQLRLESDENLVQIVTVHKSKGLQYEIVFCPFLWDGKLWVEAESGKGKPFLFHDPETRKPCLELGSDQQDELRAHARREELAEKLRLLYVALTRARQRCVLVWGAIKDAGTSAPAWLLHGPAAGSPGATPEEVARSFAGLPDDQALLSALAPLPARSGGTIRIDSVGDVTAQPYRASAGLPVALRARELARPVPRGYFVASFSALIGGLADPVADPLVAAAGTGDAELPDHDARPFVSAPSLAAGAAPAAPTIFSLERGVRTGRCLHEILEELDFTAVPPDGADGGAIAAVAARRLAAHGFDAGWLEVASEAVRRALVLPLDAGGTLRLAGLPAQRCAKELEFYYPVAGLDAARLRRALLEHGLADGRFARDVERLSFPRIAGFMRGFVDLIFESDGRFHVVDYKSNHLGGHVEDYAPERLAASVAREGYWLQYLIYTVTLHRLLRLRLPGYDPAEHLGGVFYVFLRGLDATRGPGFGVFHDRPSARLVLALDALLGGDGRDRPSGGETGSGAGSDAPADSRSAGRRRS